MISKQTLRERFKSNRNALSQEKWAELSDLIQQQFIDWFRSGDFKSLGIYIESTKQREIATIKIIQQLQFKGISLSVPKVTSENGEMEFVEFHGIEKTQVNKWGIPEPVQSHAVARDGLDVLIVPMMGGDQTGGRLGYGKGFYDRYLADFPGISVGLCPNSCILTEIPMDSHDKKLDLIITESTIIRSVDYQK